MVTMLIIGGVVWIFGSFLLGPIVGKRLSEVQPVIIEE